MADAFIFRPMIEHWLEIGKERAKWEAEEEQRRQELINLGHDETCTVVQEVWVSERHLRRNCDCGFFNGGFSA